MFSGFKIQVEEVVPIKVLLHRSSMENLERNVTVSMNHTGLKVYFWEIPYI